MKKWCHMRWMLFLLPISLCAGPFVVQDYTSVRGMKGFSDSLIDLHLKLYEGYVTQANLLYDKLNALSGSTVPEYGALKRRFEWEFNGMRLHELYFGNLGGDGVIDSKGALFAALEKQFESFARWQTDFIATGLMRGIGWSVLYLDTTSGRLMNVWIEEHDTGHPALSEPLLVMDVFEHAYMPQYGLDKRGYIDAFFRNVNWDIVEARFDGASAEIRPLPR